MHQMINKVRSFKLTPTQKAEFGEMAIKQLTNANPQFPTNLAVDEIGGTNIIFSNYSKSVKDENTLVFLFDYYGMDIFCYLNGTTNGNFSDDIRPLYLDYMCQTFGEPYREQALAYWQKRAAEEYNEYRRHKTSELTKLTTALDQQEKTILGKHDSIFDSLTSKEPQKLTHFTAPKIKPHTADAATEPTPDREK